jgi:hypothetical protein
MRTRDYHLQTGKKLHGFGVGESGHWNEYGHSLAGGKIFERAKHLLTPGETGTNGAPRS